LRANKEQNGLSDFLEKMKYIKKTNEENQEKQENQIKYVELDKEDIQRSPIVSRILDIYNTTQIPIQKPQPNSSIPIRGPFTPISTRDDAAMLPKSQIPKSM
jgi:hypothetical protein